MSSDISVVIPAFNSVFLKESLASVFSQALPPSEVILIDGSPEMTLPQIAEYRHHIRYYYQTPTGVSAARNFGMKLAQRKYIALLDADDLWLPHKVETEMRAFGRYPDAGFCFSAIWNLSDCNNPLIPQEPFLPPTLEKWVDRCGENDHVSFGSAYRLLLDVNCIGTSSLVIRRSAFEDIGFFDESLKNAEDYDFELRLARRYAAIFIRRPVSRYRIHGTGLSGGWEKRPQIFHESNARVLAKHLKTNPSFAVLRALSGTYAEYARWQLARGMNGKARSLVLRSLLLSPSWRSLKLAFESCVPALYRNITGFARKLRVGL